MGAFTNAMLDQVARPERDVRFVFSVVGGRTISCSCRDFTVLRPEEERLIRACLRGAPKPRVLDVGCGIGRHSAFVRSLSPGAFITLVESDPQLLAHSCAAIPGSTGYARLSEVPGDACFDLVLLLGNGLGVFGTEHDTIVGLKRVYSMLAEGGHAVIESGNFNPAEFSAVPHRLRYEGVADHFTWGYATHNWVRRQLESIGFRALEFTESSQPGPFFIVTAER